MNIEDFLAKINYTPGDLRPSHDAIAAVIVDKDKKILMLDHVKFNFMTIPIGKVEPHQSVEQGLIQELKEEINITVSKFKRIGMFKSSYMRLGKKVKITTYIYFITKWTGVVKNNEPHKHRSIKWMSIKEIKQVKKLSTSTKEMLKILGKKGIV